MFPIAPPDPDDLPYPLPSLPVLEPESHSDWPLESGYTRSRHIVPACYVRLSPDVPLPSLPANEDLGTRDSRTSAIMKGVESILQARIDHDNSSDKPGCQKVLWICLNRYAKQDVDPGKVGTTMFFLHPNSTVKELWEPTIQRLLKSSDASQIDEVWAWDIVQTGDSALLNEGKLDSLFDWHDVAHDLINFLAYYLPRTFTPASLPVHLPKLSPDESSRRLSTLGFSNSRRLVTVGHSFGGAISILAALEHHQLFDSMLLIDPAASRPPWFDETAMYSSPDFIALRHYRNHPLLIPASSAAFGRRRLWKSREAASKQLLQSPFFQRWHPEVFQTYLRHGLYQPSPSDQTVRLKTSPLYETMMFAEVPTGSEEAWVRILELDEKIRLRWILPALGEFDIREPGQTIDTATRRPRNSAYVRAKKAGHMVPQEDPEDTASMLERFLHELHCAPMARL